ncbi:hypothetical protein TTHERM_00381090 (macronuclear) [Tetrahymena thermophila SB210]|uniref:Zinc carboxypeptidase family protein n=2 Tax=Tetrahymena thermophila (strain SB210) TaxID=312017 RepID=Q23FA6_TETTS|nr:hypothetical protein TTHERM_00381090 [Tetrahymena thermophila SB210]EAR95247.1 hypothetical protein TTHERM_00381090 [Tetrahymena thermophila SB210]|eukprot:XP_001015492.1 hypothetical protein TTHERM_00381090 [Tetrahymena thermophila SB210]
MNQIQKRTCEEHKLTYTSIYVDSNSQSVLKCLRCLQQNLDFQKIIPIESIQNNDNSLLQNWTLSEEKNLTEYFKQVQDEIKQQNYDQKIESTRKQFKEFLVQLSAIIEKEKDKQLQQITNEKELLQKYFYQYQDLTYWVQFKNLMINEHQYQTQELNQRLRQIIQNSVNNQKNAKIILSKLMDDIKQQKNPQNSNTIFQEIYKLIEDFILKIQGRKSKPVFSFQQQNNNQFSQEKNEQNQNPNIQDNSKKFNFQKNGNFFPNQNQNCNQQQNGQSQTYFQDRNMNFNNQFKQNMNGNMFRDNEQNHCQNEKNSQNVKEIMNLISNRTNGCQAQFLQNLESMLINTKEIFQNLSFENAFMDKQYPLQLEQLDEIQFSKLIEYSKFPNQFQFTKIDDNDKNKEKKDANSNQDLINFESTNYQKSQHFKLKLEHNSILIDNTNKCYQGQIVTSTSLNIQKIYQFRMSFNKSFVNNMLYFGLISSNDKDTKSLKDIEQGFTFSNLSNKKPSLIFGPGFQEENIKIEVRVNLKNGTMHIFQYPEYSSIYVQSLENIREQQNIHFGIQYQTEQQFKIKLFDNQILEI